MTEPDKNCITTPDGNCIGGRSAGLDPCMHDEEFEDMVGTEVPVPTKSVLYRDADDTGRCDIAIIKQTDLPKDCYHIGKIIINSKDFDEYCNEFYYNWFVKRLDD